MTVLNTLRADAAQYVRLASLLWNHGQHDLASRLGMREPEHHDATQRRSAESLARDIEQLGPAYIKLAQIASTRQDAIPHDYVEALSRLQDDVDTVPWEAVEQTIEEELGVSPSTLFSEIDQQPLATASIGQVHRARLRDGRAVVVKVQRPGVAEDSREQLASLKRLAAMVDENSEIGKRFRFCSLVGAVEYAINSELDYRQEANHLQQLCENLSSFDRIEIPMPCHQLVSTKVLVMEYLDGISLKKISGAVLTEIDTVELADQLVRAYLQQVLIDGLFHADPHPGNLLLHRGHKIALLDGGMVVQLSPLLRREIGALLLAFSEGEGERASTIAIRLGRTDDDFDVAGFRASASRVIAGAGDGAFDRMSIGRSLVDFLDASGKHGLVLPYEMILLSKAFLQLEATLQQLNPNQDPKAMIREHSVQLLTHRAKEQLSLGQIAATALDSAQLASALPSRINEITRLLAANQLRLDIDAVDEAEMLAGLRKIANRITSGVIVAAMIIGASLIMRVDSGAQLFGYPVLATVFFLIAAIIGGVLVWKATFSDNY